MTLIAHLGGPMAVARSLGRRHGVVSSWYVRGLSDTGKWRLLRLAMRTGIVDERGGLEALIAELEALGQPGALRPSGRAAERKEAA